MPDLQCNNRLLLQLFFLKDEDKTWNDITEFAVNFLDIPKSRIRTLIEKTYSIALQLNDDGCEQFLSTQASFVGPYLAKLGITRNDLLNKPSTTITRSVITTLTNGALLDLVSFQKKEGLQTSWIYDATLYLSNVALNRQSFSEDLKKLQATARKKSKSRNRDIEAYESFYSAPFAALSVVNASTPLSVTKQPQTPPTVSCRKRIKLDDSEKENEIQHSPLCLAPKEITVKKLKSALDTSNDNLEKERRTTETLQKKLQEDRLDFNSQIKQYKNDSDLKDQELSSLQIKYDTCKSSLKAAVASLEQKSKEILKLRHAPYYKRLKRWESRLKMKAGYDDKSHVEIRENKIKSLKAKLKKSQTLLSNVRQNNKKATTEKMSLAAKIVQMKEDFLKQDQTEPRLIMREPNSNKFTKDVTKCAISLIGQAEVSGKNCGSVIDIVVRNLFHIKLDRKDLPSERSSLRFADKGHVLAKCQLAETLLTSANVDLHSDGTSRDHNKVVGHQLSTDAGLVLSCGFIPVCKEDTNTLVDIAYNLLTELSELYKNDELDDTFHTMLKHVTGLMSDRASVMKAFNKSFNDRRNVALGVNENVEFLHCNAHFLLGLSSATEKILKLWEKSQEQKIGRDKVDKFKRFTSSESSGSRYIRTACDILGPRGDEKNGCKDSWEAFCDLQELKSTVTSFKGNRFNNLFQAAASLHHHRTDIMIFLKDYMPALNLKQDSVLYDASCQSVDAMTVSLGIVFHKITGPYWILIGSDVQYLDFFQHVMEMYEALAKWELDATEMVDEGSQPLFKMALQNNVLSSLYVEMEPKKAMVLDILQKLCAAYKDVVQRQLVDFLPEGRYHNIQDEEQRQKMKHSKITNLLGEECFGDLDFSIFKRRHASLHHHSTINMLKRNDTLNWFEAKSKSEQERLLTICDLKSGELRRNHQMIQKLVLQERRENLKKNKIAKAKKAAELLSKKRKIVDRIKQHGGPCTIGKDIALILNNLDTNTERVEALKDEIRYHKMVLGAKSHHLRLSGSLEAITENLKAFLDNITSKVTNEIENDSTSTNDSRLSDDMEEENAEDDFESVVDSSDFGNFQFSKQGEFIAVFYDNDYYIGQVLSCNGNEGDVKFLDKCCIKKNAFRWTMREPETVSAIYVIEYEIDMATTNGRIWTLTNSEIYDNLERKHKLYKELYC